MKLFQKDGIKYLFAGKNDEFNVPYGVSASDIEKIDRSLETNIEFLKNSFVSSGGLKVSLFELSMSANINPKCFRSELYSRVKSLKDYALKIGFDTPFFITLTPPSYFKPLKQIKIKKNIVKLVDNPNFSGLCNYVDEARSYISNKWRKFTTQRIFKDIKKEFGSNMIYLRVYEPFLDGTPHCHLLCFIPAKFKDRFKALVKNYFKESRTDIKTDFENGVDDVIAYVLKYVLKSFANAKDNNRLDFISYWHIKFKIRRFGTSRTLIPMYIFRKVRYDERFRDLIELTELRNKGALQIEIYANTDKLVNGEKLLASDKKLAGILISYPIYDDVCSLFVVYEKSKHIVIKLANGDKITVSGGFIVDIKTKKSSFKIIDDVNHGDFSFLNEVLPSVEILKEDIEDEV